MSTGDDKKKVRTPGEDARAMAESQAALELVGGGSLDKVRDILFGANIRDNEKRFNQLEERLIKESNDLRLEVRKRLDTLEAYVKRELDSLNDRIKSENNERSEADKEITQELRDFIKGTDKRIGQIDEFANKTQRELRQQMLDQSKQLADEILQKSDELSAALEKAVKELRNEKTDRYALATLFTEVAMRLNNQFKIPGSEGFGNG